MISNRFTIITRTALISALVIMILWCSLSVCKDSVHKDFIAVDIAYSTILQENNMPYIWKGPAYVLAELNDAQQNKLLALIVPFSMVKKDVKEWDVIYIFEINDKQAMPEEWAEKVLFRYGREVILEMNPETASTWIDKGYRAIRLFHQEHTGIERKDMVPFACSYNAIVDDLLSRTNQEQWIDWDEKITGVDPVVIGGTTYTIDRRQSENMFNGNIYAKAYDFILQQSRSWRYGTSRTEEDSYAYSGYVWKNLILTIPGQSNPDEVVAVTAHLDSKPTSGVAPGADDNGTGSITLLEAARLLRQFRFQRTIKIIWFSGEGQGLIGSAAYVANHDVSNYLGVINGDLFGYDGDADRCFEIHVGTIPASDDIGNCINDTITSYSLSLPHDYLITDATSLSDHSSFWNANVGAVSVGENFFNTSSPGGCVGADPDPYYHTVNDTVALAVVLPYAYDIHRAILGSIAAMAIPVQSCFATAPVLTAMPAPLKVDLSWTTDTGGAYRLYRSTQGCQGQWLEQVETTNSEYSDTDLTAGSTYYYYVEAVDSDGFCVSAMSNCVSAVPFPGPHAQYTSGTFTDSCPGGGPGNNNGIIDPGETITTRAALTNDGVINLTDVSGIVWTTASGIAITSNLTTFPDIAIGEIREGNLPDYAYRVSSTFACGSTIPFFLRMSYNEGLNTTSFEHQVGTVNPGTVFNEDWEGQTGNWIMSGLWHVTDQGDQDCFAEPYPSPTRTAYYGQDSTCNYSTGSATSGTMDSAVFSGILPNSALRFQSWREVEYYNGPYDITAVYVSVDGTNWIQIWYLDSSTPSMFAWTDSDDIWLSSWAGQTIQVRFRFDSVDGSGNNHRGWAIDNVQVTGAASQCNVCADSAPSGRVLNNLLVSKFFSAIVLNWSAVTGSCDVTGYGVYRGSLPWTGYNHASRTCSASCCTYSDFSAPENSYYLVIPLNPTSEGSYGTDSSGSERPQGFSPCNSQNSNPC